MKKLPTILKVILLVAGACYILCNLVFFKTDENGIFLTYATFNILSLVGIYLLVSSGTILNTNYWRAMLLASSAVLIGALAKIQHWIAGDFILSTALLSFPVIYMIRFSRKQHKDILDVLKLTWVITFFGLKTLVLLHIISKEANLVSTFILLIACTLCLLRKKKVRNEFDFIKQNK